MEVILLEDVKTLGKKGQVVKVNDGYARNVVLPKKWGIEATSKNLNDLKLRNANDEKIAKEQLEAARKLAEDIGEMSLKMQIKTGEGGRTFGSVSSKEIAEEAKKQLGLELDKKKIALDEPIRTPGTHIVSVKLHREVVAKLKVVVGEK